MLGLSTQPGWLTLTLGLVCQVSLTGITKRCSTAVSILSLLDRSSGDTSDSLNKAFSEFDAEVTALRERVLEATSEKINVEPSRLLHAAVKEFDRSPLAILALRLPRAKAKDLDQFDRAVERALAEILGRFSDPGTKKEEKAGYAIDRLSQLSETANRLRTSCNKHNLIWSRRIRRSVLAVAILGLLYAVTQFFARFSQDVEFEEFVVVYPEPPYESPRHLASNERTSHPRFPTEKEKRRFIANYFGPQRINRFYRVVKGRAHNKVIGQRWKLIYRNDAFQSSMFISHVGVNVEYEPPNQGFWRDFNFDTKLVGEVNTNAVIAISSEEGIPAFNLEWTCKTDNGIVLGSGHQWLMNQESRFDPHRHFNRGHYIPFDIASFPNGFTFQGKPLNALDELEQLTTVVRKGNFVLKVTYETIERTKKELILNAELPDDRLFFQDTAGLEYHGPNVALTPHTSERVFVALDSNRPQGSEVVSVDLTINHVDDESPTYVGGQVDERMSAGGHLCLYLNLPYAKGGKYTLQPTINGNPISQLSVDCWAPSSNVFPAAEQDRWEIVNQVWKDKNPSHVSIPHPPATDNPLTIGRYRYDMRSNSQSRGGLIPWTRPTNQ